MKVLVVGSGGREHAMVMKLSKSPRIEKLFCAPGNGGISKFAHCFDVKVSDTNGMVALAKKLEADMVVVAPEEPLANGLVDSLNAVGIRTFGPSKAAAIIEGSKVFSKNLMKKYHIPTAKYEVFDNADDAIAYIQSENTYPIVIKADGLALGKGVIIAENFAEARKAVTSMIEDGAFGESGRNIVIEEFMTGPEVTVLAFTDGKTIVPMMSSMDHKRAYDNDIGPNTGGMGAIAPNPHYNEGIEKECMKKIFLPTIRAMEAEGRTFKGCLYFGLMLTPSGPRVIEYNCRFGDPEAQVVLSMLESDLLTIFDAVFDEKLDSIKIKWRVGASACIIMASGGYPKAYETGKEIIGLDAKGQVSNSFVFHAGTAYSCGKFTTAGGRVLGVTAWGGTLDAALGTAYSSVKSIKFEDMHYRTDIGRK